jgi:ATP-dependent exoDNAse (exonuclease V) beta subunit
MKIYIDMKENFKVLVMVLIVACDTYASSGVKRDDTNRSRSKSSSVARRNRTNRRIPRFRQRTSRKPIVLKPNPKSNHPPRPPKVPQRKPAASEPALQPISFEYNLEDYGLSFLKTPNIPEEVGTLCKIVRKKLGFSGKINPSRIDEWMQNPTHKNGGKHPLRASIERFRMKNFESLMKNAEKKLKK